MVTNIVIKLGKGSAYKVSLMKAEADFARNCSRGPVTGVFGARTVYG
jgi:hypothetical protein